MSDFLYAELRRHVEGVIKPFEGPTTDTAATTVDKNENTIKVDVLKCPGKITLSLDKEGSEEIEFDGSEDVSFNLYDYLSGKAPIIVESDPDMTVSQLPNKAFIYYSGTSSATFLGFRFIGLNNHIGVVLIGTQGYYSAWGTIGGMTMAEIMVPENLHEYAFSADITEQALNDRLFTITDVVIDDDEPNVHEG